MSSIVEDSIIRNLFNFDTASSNTESSDTESSHEISIDDTELNRSCKSITFSQQSGPEDIEDDLLSEENGRVPLKPQLKRTIGCNNDERDASDTPKKVIGFLPGDEFLLEDSRRYGAQSNEQRKYGYYNDLSLEQRDAPQFEIFSKNMASKASPRNSSNTHEKVTSNFCENGFPLKNVDQYQEMKNIRQESGASWSMSHDEREKAFFQELGRTLAEKLMLDVNHYLEEFASGRKEYHREESEKEQIHEACKALVSNVISVKNYSGVLRDNSSENTNGTAQTGNPDMSNQPREEKLKTAPGQIVLRSSRQILKASAYESVLVSKKPDYCETAGNNFYQDPRFGGNGKNVQKSRDESVHQSTKIKHPESKYPGSNELPRILVKSIVSNPDTYPGELSPFVAKCKGTNEELNKQEISNHRRATRESSPSDRMMDSSFAPNINRANQHFPNIINGSGVSGRVQNGNHVEYGQLCSTFSPILKEKGIPSNISEPKALRCDNSTRQRSMWDTNFSESVQPRGQFPPYLKGKHSSIDSNYQNEIHRFNSAQEPESRRYDFECCEVKSLSFSALGSYKNRKKKEFTKWQGEQQHSSAYVPKYAPSNLTAAANAIQVSGNMKTRARKFTERLKDSFVIPFRNGLRNR